MNYNLNYVHPQKAKYLNEAGLKFVKKSSAKVETYDNAIVLPALITENSTTSYGCGGVVDKNNNYIEMSKTKGRIYGGYIPEYVEEKNEKVVFCGYFNKGWGHFITEVVSRLWYVLKNDTTIDSYVFVQEMDGNKQFVGNFLEFFRLLGIDDKVKIINKPTRFSTVVIPEEGLVYNEYYTDEFVKMYKYINKKGLDEYTGPSYEKVFFSKRRCVISIKSNLNEKFVDKFFEKNGYKVFYPEKLSLVDTIGIMQNAKYFCALSSSLAHNQLFGHENQTMISIEKQAFYNPYQIFVANITNCECIFIDACWSIFAVNSAGPFIFDYTEHLDNFVKDYGLKPGKPMSEFKFKRIFKRYLAYYFDFNNELPPDYMYEKYIVDMTREAYNYTIKHKKVFHLSFAQRVLVKLKIYRLKFINR